MKSRTRTTSLKSTRRASVRHFADSLSAEGYVVESSEDYLGIKTHIGGVTLMVCDHPPLLGFTAVIDLDHTGTPEELLDLLNRLNRESTSVRHFRDDNETSAIRSEMDVHTHGDGVSGVAVAELLESFIFECEIAIETMQESGLLVEDAEESP
jgi:hypothetical protein